MAAAVRESVTAFIQVSVAFFEGFDSLMVKPEHWRRSHISPNGQNFTENPDPPCRPPALGPRCFLDSKLSTFLPLLPLARAGPCMSQQLFAVPIPPSCLGVDLTVAM